MKTINIIMGYRMGGIFSVYQLLAPELAKRFHINTVTLDDRLRQGDIPGINQIDLNVVSPLKGFRLINFLFRFIYATKRYHLDNFVVNNQSIAIIVYLVSKMFRFNFFVHQHSSLDESIDTKNNRLLKKLYLMLLRLAFRNARCVICNSLNIENNVINTLGVNNTIMIYNPVDIDAVKAGSEKPLAIYFKEDCYNFVIVGRLSYEKGHETLIKAINVLKNSELAKFKVYIIGNGQEYEKLNNLIKQYSLQSFVELTGFISEPYQYIKQCDCYLSTSLWEAFGLTLAYSMILKKQIIASKTGAAVELLVDSGSLFEIGDFVGLSCLMIKAISRNTINEAVIERNYQKAMQFDVRTISDEFSAVFEKLA